MPAVQAAADDFRFGGEAFGLRRLAFAEGQHLRVALEGSAALAGGENRVGDGCIQLCERLNALVVRESTAEAHALEVDQHSFETFAVLPEIDVRCLEVAVHDASAMERDGQSAQRFGQGVLLARGDGLDLVGGPRRA